MTSITIVVTILVIVQLKQGVRIITKLDEAMRKHMRHIVTNEHRPFSFLDFLAFEVEGYEYHMSHGTFRNKISAIRKRAGVDVVSYSPQGFYTLKGVEIANSMERNHTGVTLSSNLAGQPLRYLKNHPIYKIIQNTPFDKNALHDIRLRFTVQGIWAALCTSDNPTIDPVSKDIRLISQEINELDIKVTIHHTDTVSVVVGCSCAPIVVDIAGVSRLSNALTLVEERLAKMLDECGGVNCGPVPNHLTWIVTMWHFGADASIQYKGTMFHVSWKIAETALIAFYTKIWNDGKHRIRAER
ncbi:MAG: hypothetical protein M3044_06850, partial [Thermoproteota archaeon]|nr:hypothetical protein [Thermoproteota archaeon]